MKKCPQCKQLFSTDYAFCLEDGSTLYRVDEDGEAGATVAAVETETATRVLPSGTVEPTGQAAPESDSGGRETRGTARAAHSKWLYALLGGLTTLLILLGAAVYLNWPDARGAGAADPVRSPAFKPSGVWKGEWTSEKGGLSSAVATLNDDGANQISGFIVWTLRRSINPNKKDRTGMKAVEYVQGTYDPLTRVVSVTGYRKKDPNDLIVLDSYRLTLSEDNNRLQGATRNQGRWSGRLRLERAE